MINDNLIFLERAADTIASTSESGGIFANSSNIKLTLIGILPFGSDCAELTKD